MTGVEIMKAIIEILVGGISGVATGIGQGLSTLAQSVCKKTCLWLKGLPVLKSTRLTPLPKEYRTQSIWKGNFNGKSYSWNSSECSRLRSVTPIGVANAMSDQWGQVLSSL